jgi:hypothetical protein
MNYFYCQAKTREDLDDGTTVDDGLNQLDEVTASDLAEFTTRSGRAIKPTTKRKQELEEKSTCSVKKHKTSQKAKTLKL